MESGFPKLELSDDARPAPCLDGNGAEWRSGAGEPGLHAQSGCNLINRLKNNTSRLHELPADLQTLVSSEEKSKLISMLCEADGNLEVMMGNFRAMQAGCLSIRLQGCRDHSTFRFLAIGLTHVNYTA